MAVRDGCGKICFDPLTGWIPAENEEGDVQIKKSPDGFLQVILWHVAD
jgi:hypothetical protein